MFFPADLIREEEERIAAWCAQSTIHVRAAKHLSEGKLVWGVRTQRDTVLDPDTHAGTYDAVSKSLSWRGGCAVPSLDALEDVQQGAAAAFGRASPGLSALLAESKVVFSLEYAPRSPRSEEEGEIQEENGSPVRAISEQTCGGAFVGGREDTGEGMCVSLEWWAPRTEGCASRVVLSGTLTPAADGLAVVWDDTQPFRRARAVLRFSVHESANADRGPFLVLTWTLPAAKARGANARESTMLMVFKKRQDARVPAALFPDEERCLGIEMTEAELRADDRARKYW